MSKKIKYFYHNGVVMDAKGEKGDDGAQGPTGPQGPQGESFQPIEDVSGLVLAHTLGNDNTKAMSQKGVTESIADTFEFKEYTDDYFSIGQGLCLSVWSYMPNQYPRTHKVIKLNGEKFLKVVANDTKEAKIGFLTSYTAPTTHSQEVPYCAGYSNTVNIDAGAEDILVIPNDCKYIVIDCLDNGATPKDYTPVYVGVSIASKDESKTKKVLEFTTSAGSTADWVNCTPISVKAGKVKVTLTGLVSKRSAITDAAPYIYIYTQVGNVKTPHYMIATVGGANENTQMFDNANSISSRSFEFNLLEDAELGVWHRIAVGQSFTVKVEQLVSSEEILNEKIQQVVAESTRVVGVFKEVESYFAYGQGCALSIWSYDSSYERTHRVVKVGDAKSIKITANSTDEARIAFVKSYTAPTAHGDSVDWCYGYSQYTSIATGTTEVFDVPSDCNYIIINCLHKGATTNYDWTPSYVGIEESLEEATKNLTPIKAWEFSMQNTNADWNKSSSMPAKKGKIRITLTGPVSKYSTISNTAPYIYIYADGPVALYMASTFGGSNANVEIYDNVPSISSRIIEATLIEDTNLNVWTRIASGQSLTIKLEQLADAKELIDTKVNDVLSSEVAIMPIRYQSDYSSRHFVALTDGFKVVNGYSGFCYIKNSSSTFTEGTIGILGEPTPNFTQQFNFNAAASVGSSINTNTQIKVVVVTNDGEHVITNNTGNAFSRSWYVDGASTGMPYANPIRIKAVEGVGQVEIIGSDDVVVLNDLTITSVYLKIKNNDENPIALKKYINDGYRTLLHTHPQRYHKPHPMDVYGTKLYVAYYAPNGYLTIYERDFLTGVTKTSQKSVLRQGDMHEWISMIIDNDGCMHIMCNCHGTYLYYYYGSVSNIDEIAESDKLSCAKASYPTFEKYNNELYAVYRNWVSNKGTLKIFAYDYISKIFTATTQDNVYEGYDRTTWRLPYFELEWCHDEVSGWWYNSFCWRETSNADTNYDICFIKTQDFDTFYDIDGNELTLPITSENREQCRLKEIPINSHLLNQQGVRTLLINGNPIVVYFMDDKDDNTNLFMMYFEGGKKIERQLTHYVGNNLSIIHVSYDNMPGFVTLSFVNYIAAYDISRSIFIAPDLTVYDSENIVKDLTDENGKTSLIQDSSNKIWTVFKGSEYVDNYDNVHNYGIQIIE